MDARPLGDPIDWIPARPPGREPLAGSEILLRPVDAGRDTEPIYAASHSPSGDERVWTYLPDGPYESVEQMRAAMEAIEDSEDPHFYSLVRAADQRPLGRAAYMRITPEFGVIEIGSILMTPELQRTRAATEAIFLMIRRAFDELGYRRVEWKCNALNAPSRRAAERFGFEFEGVFRQHMIVKGRNRDTAWFAILDGDWPAIRAGFEAWLEPGNFDGGGAQKQPLGAFMP